MQNNALAKNALPLIDEGRKERSLIGYRDLFGFLKREEEPESTSQAHDLLKTAYKMLENAERELSERDQRIVALENILTVDELTQLTNRRGFYKAFRGELDRTNRGENKGGLLIMIDLDKFKAINDTYGHQAGDEALRVVARFLQKTTRDMDVAARLGGDEFILLMPNTSIAKAIMRATQIGKDLNKLSFEWDGTTININGSLGLKEYKSGDTIEAVIESADQGMYANKEMRKQITTH